MPNFLLGLSFLPPPFPLPLSANTLCDKYQMLGSFSPRHDAFFFFPSFMTFHSFKPMFSFCQRPDEQQQPAQAVNSVACIFCADDRYWVFREADVLPGYPQPLHQYGQGVPAHKIDTAIWWEPTGYTYFFSGDRCVWLFVCFFKA